MGLGRHRRASAHEVRHRRASAHEARHDIEWPTIGLLICVHGSWAAILMTAGALTPPIAASLLVPVMVLHSSLQHEVMHGHPFHSRALSEAVVSLPIGLLVPYRRFRAQHLAHHFDPSLTDPYDDPETNYLDPARWARMGPMARALYRANNTLAGRMALGPAISLAAFWREEVRGIARGAPGLRRDHAAHLAGAAVVALAVWASALPWWGYALGCYGAMMVLKIRTFAEHRAHHAARARTVVIEDRGILALLFLNNNFHALHHARPGLAWYRLPAAYFATRAAVLRRNGGYVYRSYAQVIGAHFLRAKDPVAHPLLTDPSGHAAPAMPAPVPVPVPVPAFASGAAGA